MSTSKLPNRLLKVFQLSSNFRAAVKVVEEQITSKSSLKPDELLLRNLYVGVNATDLNITSGRYFAHGPIPYPLGIESLGEVVQTANPKYQIGDLVVVKPSPMRAYAEYLVLSPSDNFTPFPKPPSNSELPKLLALLGTSGLTAAIGLSEAARIKPGETVLITAAAGGLGHLAAQWALLKGARVVAVVGSEQKREFLEKLGAKFERIINYRNEDLSAVLKAEYPSGLDIIWETVGTPLFEQLFEHLARRGRLVNVGATAGYQTVGYADISIENFIAKLHYGARTLIGFLVSDYKSCYEEYTAQLLDYYQRGMIEVKVQTGTTSGTEFVGLEAVADAIEALHSGTTIGKVVVKVTKN